jgi:uncharacterized protein YjiS (DUF1127 family)
MILTSAGTVRPFAGVGRRTEEQQDRKDATMNAIHTLHTLTSWIDLIGVWRQRARERAELTAMSGRALQDIGITRWEARLEADKPFWRA